MTNIERRTVQVPDFGDLDLFGVYSPTGLVIAAFETYAEAQAYSDRLAFGDE